MTNGLGRTFSSLRIRNYRFYFAGQSTSLVGTWMQSVAQSWFVFAVTHSGFQVGLVVAFQTVPILLFGPIGGTIADRFGKYRVLFLTQSLAGIQAGILAGLDLSGNLKVWEVYLIAMSLGFVNMIDNPTRQTFIGEIVGMDQLPNAVTLNSVMVNVARIVGPAIAGIIIAASDTGWCFLFNAVSFVFVLAALVAMRKEELVPTPRAKTMRGQILQGFKYVARRPLLRDTLIMMAVIGCLAYEFQVSLPLLAGVTFRGNSTTYGLLTSAMGVGAVVGGLIAAGRRNRSSRRFVNTALGFGVVILIASVMPTLWAEGLAMVLVGAGSVTFLSLGNSTLQLEADPEMRGRVMSLWSVSFQGSTPVGGPLVGFVGEQLGARFSLGLGGVAALGMGLFGLLKIHSWTSNRDALPAPDNQQAGIKPRLAGAEPDD